MYPRLFFIAFLFVFVFIPAGFAQEIFVGSIDENERVNQGPQVINQYDPKYRKKLPAHTSGNPLSNAHHSVFFARKPGLEEGEVVLRIFQPLAISGCASVTLPEAQIRKDGRNMWILVGKPDIKIDQSSHYAHHTCNNITNTAVIDVTLNLKELNENNVQNLALNSSFGTDHYDIETSEHRISLRPRSTKFFEPYGHASTDDPLTYWFYPKNTIVLSVPQAGDDQDLTHSITTLALQNGLVSLEEHIKDFEQPLNRKNTLYFIDEKGASAQKFSGNKHLIFGAITSTETFSGPEGPYQVAKKLDVLAKRPGLLE